MYNEIYDDIIAFLENAERGNIVSLGPHIHKGMKGKYTTNEITGALEILVDNKRLVKENSKYKLDTTSNFKDIELTLKLEEDMVNNPKHYTDHPSGVECIDITEHMTFNLGNAVKYLWRFKLKHDSVVDLEKAIFYINREITRLKTSPK